MEFSSIAIYYCHSPITYSISLARSRKYKKIETPFFVSARSFRPPKSVLHIEFDNLGGYQEVLQFSENWNNFVHEMEGDGRRIVLHVPHLAILPIRLMLSDSRISGYSFIEEGSLFYVDNLSERSHGAHDYVTWFGIDELLIDELCVNFSSDRNQLISALTGEWSPFNWRVDRMLGATVAIENSLSEFSRDRGIPCEVLPLEKIECNGLHDSAVILLPPLSSGWVNYVFLSFIIEYAFSCSGVEKVFLKLHPDNSSLDYEFPDRFEGRLFFYDVLPGVIGVDKYVTYLEPATLNFRLFLTAKNSTKIYIDFLHKKHDCFELSSELSRAVVSFSVGLNPQLRDISSTVNDLQLELSYVYQSRSWLITKPLRILHLRLKKFISLVLEFFG